MSKQSSDDFINLQPGDVIHINERQPKKTRPPAKPEPEAEEPPEPPIRRPRPPAFDIPLVEEKKSEFKPRSTPVISEQPQPPEEVVQSPETAAAEELPPVAPVAETVPQTEIEIPATTDNDNEIPPPSGLDDFVNKLSAPKVITPPSPSPQIAPADLPEQGLSFEPLSAVEPAQLLEPNPQSLRIPPPLLSSLPPSNPMPTTDLQGNLATMPLAVPAPPPPVMPEVWPETEVEAEKDLDRTDDEPKSKQHSNRNLKIFGVVTLFFIVSTIAAGLFFFGPMLQQALDSRRLDGVREFEHVLINLLQVENQEIEIKLTDSQVENIVPVLDNQDAVSGGTVSVEGDLRIEHLLEADNSSIGSEFRFDLNLQTSDRRDNLVLDITTIFTQEGKAYFRLDSLSINDRPVDLSKTAFVGRWSDLQDLLQSQAGIEGAVLEENKSVFLNYIANLLNLYSYPHYLVLLPTFNISQSQHYNRVKEVLLASEAYKLDADSCRLNGDVELQCRLKIDYGHLYDLYEDIYDILGQSMPAYYEILKIADNPSSNLPTTVELVFDKSRDYPVSLTVPMSASNISASTLTIEYSNFDEPTFEAPTFADPLSVLEYHDHILRYEEEIDFSS